MLGPGVGRSIAVGDAGGQWYGGHGPGAPTGVRACAAPSRNSTVRPGTARRRIGGDRSGAWAGRRSVHDPDGSWPRRTARPNIGGMQIIGAAPPTRSRVPSLVIGAAAGTILIVSGLTFEFATLLTPYFDRVARGGFGGSAGPSGAAAWFAAVVLGAVFLGVGAARLAGLLADVRSGAAANPVILPAHDPDEPVMALNVDVGDGRPIPKLVRRAVRGRRHPRSPGRFGGAPPGTVLGSHVRPGLGPHREPARSCRSRRGAGPSLVRPRRTRLRRSRLRRGRDTRSRAAPNPDVRGDQRVTARTVAAVTARAAQPQRRAAGAAAGDAAGSLARRSGRGARTRTWNQRDISPPL